MGMHMAKAGNRSHFTGAVVALVAAFGTYAWGATPQRGLTPVKGPEIVHDEPVAGAAANESLLCPEFPTAFDGFYNLEVGKNASVNVMGNELIVSGLSVTSAVTSCTPPANGVDVCLGLSEQAAGDNGMRIEHVDTRIPDDITAYFVQLNEYWGSRTTTPDWITDPMPIGFRTGGGLITACADFNKCPINCTMVVVEFKGAGTIECPAGDLFSVSDSTTLILRRILVHGLCHGGNGTCNEEVAKARATLEFVFSSAVSWTPNGACTVPPGPTSFSASRVRIKPKRSTCSEMAAACQQDTCCDALTNPSSTAALGGTTPPILSVKLLAETMTEAGTAGVAGQFRISEEAVCSVSESGACSDGLDNDCDGLVDSEDTNCYTYDPAVPALSTWGVGIFAVALCTAGALLLRRRIAAGQGLHGP